MGIMEQIRARLAEGKTPKEVIAMGFKPGSVRKAGQAPPMTSGARPPRRGTRELHAITAVRKDDNGNGHAMVVYQPEETAPEIDQDPDIVALQKELRKAQLERQLREVRASLDIEARIAVLDAEIKALKALILDDEGNCLVDALHETLGEIEGRLSQTPLVGLKDRFTCKGCGALGHVAVPIKCAGCSNETRWGWHLNSR